MFLGQIPLKTGTRVEQTAIHKTINTKSLETNLKQTNDEDDSEFFESQETPPMFPEPLETPPRLPDGPPSDDYGKLLFIEVDFCLNLYFLKIQKVV